MSGLRLAVSGRRLAVSGGCLAVGGRRLTVGGRLRTRVLRRPSSTSTRVDCSRCSSRGSSEGRGTGVRCSRGSRRSSRLLLHVGGLVGHLWGVRIRSGGGGGSRGSGGPSRLLHVGRDVGHGRGGGRLCSSGSGSYNDGTRTMSMGQ